MFKGDYRVIRLDSPISVLTGDLSFLSWKFFTGFHVVWLSVEAGNKTLAIEDTAREGFSIFEIGCTDFLRSSHDVVSDITSDSSDIGEEGSTGSIKSRCVSIFLTIVNG